MIIGQVRKIYELASLADRLGAAARGVVRVRGGGRSTASGWMITPALVVVPDYVVADPADFGCEVAGQGPVPARIVERPEPAQAGRTPGLLRLDRPIPGAEPLRLDLTAVADGAGIVLLHHPHGVATAQLSFGRAGPTVNGFLRHDADTESGSGGGPVLAAPGLGLVAMHLGRGPRGEDHNFALPLAAVLDGLRGSAAWPEIAEFHLLADVAVARPAAAEPVPAPAPPAPPDDTVIAAALCWLIDPAELTAGARAALQPLVIDPSDAEWTLPLPERQRLLRGAGSPAALRAVRRARPVVEPGSDVVERILQGPPYDLDAIPLDALPYWLQAVRWFDGIAPDLPTAAQVNRTMERRRIRGRLATIAGPGLRGRGPELAALDAWFAGPDRGPMVVSGIGGVGKSALAARFAELLPGSTPLFWLDFDRADIAPDDAVSLMTALTGQAQLQLDGFGAPPTAAPAPAPDRAAGPVATALRAAARFGADLTAAAPGPALLVLDGFEIAQRKARYQEIWPMLDSLLGAAPALRVLVSGRAPVTDLRLGGHPATGLRLTGLDPEAAAGLLREHGITDPDEVDRVITVSRGIPLVLKLAIRLAEAGGDLAELPETMVEGYLYTRILDRVVDPELRPVARDALVLRAVRADMLAAVLHDRIPDGVEPAALLTRLTRELAIVEDLDQPVASGADGLRLRPELRAAVLELLATADRARVREIDRRAAAWFAGRPAEDPADAAELVYHRLRLADLAGAGAAWRDGCAARLGNAVDDLTDPGARDWLRTRLDAESGATELALWEQDAAERIRAANKRGLDRSLVRVLQERPERGPASPLLVHDAWLRWQDGDAEGAAALLDGAEPAIGAVARDRTLLRAGLAAAAGDDDRADHLLAGLDGAERWADLGAAATTATSAVLAARVRLTVDLPAELGLSGVLPAGRWTGELPDDGLVAAVRRLVLPSDVLLPSLGEDLDGPAEEAGRAPLPLPTAPDALAAFAGAVRELRQQQRQRWPDAPAGAGDQALELARRLGEQGERRWRLGTTTPLLAGAAELLRPSRPADALELSVVASLAAFRGLPLVAPDGQDLDAVLGGEPFTRVEPELADRQAHPLVQPIIEAEDWPAITRFWRRSAAVRTVLLHALAPDPLQLLIRRVLGLPDRDAG